MTSIVFCFAVPFPEIRPKEQIFIFFSNGNYWVDNKTYGWNVFLFPFKRNFNINHKAGVQCENDHGEVPQQMLLFHQIISCKHNFKVKYLLNIWAITYISDWSNGMLERMIDDVRSQHNDNHPFRLLNSYGEASQFIWVSRTPAHYAPTLPFRNELSLTWALLLLLIAVIPGSITSNLLRSEWLCPLIEEIRHFPPDLALPGIASPVDKFKVSFWQGMQVNTCTPLYCWSVVCLPHILVMELSSPHLYTPVTPPRLVPVLVKVQHLQFIQDRSLLDTWHHSSVLFYNIPAAPIL